MSHMLYLVIGALSGQEQVVIELMALVPTCKFAFNLAVMSTVAYSKCRLTCVLFNGSRPISYVSLIRDTGTPIRQISKNQDTPIRQIYKYKLFFSIFLNKHNRIFNKHIASSPDDAR